MSGLAGILIGLVCGWVGCYVLVGRRVRQRAEWWLQAFERDSVRRPW